MLRVRAATALLCGALPMLLAPAAGAAPASAGHGVGQPPEADPVTAETHPEDVGHVDVPPRPSDGTLTSAARKRLAAYRMYDPTLEGLPVGRPSLEGAAVMAFQAVNDLPVDGVAGPDTWQRLFDGTARDPSELLIGGEDTRVEVDLTRQLAFVVVDGRLARVLHTASGNGDRYRSSSGGWANANTPVGTFHVTWRVNGVRNAPLGKLYHPLYFYNGFALHGSNSVPTEEASHGCIRLPRPDARWLQSVAPDRMQVRVHGGRHVFAPAYGGGDPARA